MDKHYSNIELPSETSLPLTFFDILWLRLPPVQRIFFYEFPHQTSLFFNTLLPKLNQSLSLTLSHSYIFWVNICGIYCLCIGM
ncbi:anthocyanidin 3-O-glucoside-6-O-malonyltransferase, putative [Medicago truncatula]|uniref:Anthocyanidin 3-O-glucoside-6-O-malonyltransferase, putative n=1 Tax=Medicago truncatula TaxID=3880 RepID=G7L654_MEDTR|nr:anthocyanidin 3-O-glucoside-6-O-malonyltransferase, putative [Medicago truncatula]